MFQWEIAASKVGEGEVLTRRQIAERMGREKTTAVIQHIDRAVLEGVLERCWCKIGNASGWAYAKPGIFRDFGWV